MTALRPFLYGGRKLSPGDTFQPTRSDARVLRAIKKAAYLTTSLESALPTPSPTGTLHALAMPIDDPSVELPEPVATEVAVVARPAAPDTPAETVTSTRRRASTTKAPRASRTYQTREIVAAPAAAEPAASEDESA
jgi:hypothetical protein